MDNTRSFLASKNTTGPIMSSPSKATKRRREEDPPTESASSALDHHKEILEFISSKLSSLNLSKSLSSQPNNDNEVFSPERIPNLKDDKELLLELHTSLEELVAELDQEEIKAHKEQSMLMVTVDQPTRDRIVDFLDEEGLWALEHSSMMDLQQDPITIGRIQDHWVNLYKNRKNAFPDVWGVVCDDSDDDDEDDDNQHGDEDTPGEATKVCCFRYYGCLFGRASRMARCMEAMAKMRYKDYVAPTRVGGFEWPANQTCTTLRLDRLIKYDKLDRHYFVRISYQEDRENSPVVVEGFGHISVWEIKEKVGQSKAIFELREVERPRKEKIFEKLLRVRESGIASSLRYESMREAQEWLGDHLSITILELEGPDLEEDPDESEMNLVISSTGYLYGYDGYLELTPRSHCFRDDDYEDYKTCMQVGLSMWDYSSDEMSIQLTG